MLFYNSDWCFFQMARPNNLLNNFFFLPATIKKNICIPHESIISKPAKDEHKVQKKEDEKKTRLCEENCSN
jgi:hypothetical protein